VKINRRCCKLSHKTIINAEHRSWVEQQPSQRTIARNFTKYSRKISLTYRVQTERKKTVITSSLNIVPYIKRTALWLWNINVRKITITWNMHCVRSFVRYCGQWSSLLWTSALRPSCRSNVPVQGEEGIGRCVWCVCVRRVHGEGGLKSAWELVW